jgi:hypothetical protein
VIEHYREAALRYRPARIRVLFIAESPPFTQPGRKPSYFFFEDSPSNLLFATILYAMTGESYTKATGPKAPLLQRLRDEGYWLIDAVEHPINDVPPKNRPEIVRKGLPDLLERLAEMRSEGVLDDSTGLAIIKNDVWATIAPTLVENRYRVLNRDAAIGFPGYHRDRRTVAAIRKAVGLSLGE